MNQLGYLIISYIASSFQLDRCLLLLHDLCYVGAERCISGALRPDTIKLWGSIDHNGFILSLDTWQSGKTAVNSVKEYLPSLPDEFYAPKNFFTLFKQEMREPKPVLCGALCRTVDIHSCGHLLCGIWSLLDCPSVISSAVIHNLPRYLDQTITRYRCWYIPVRVVSCSVSFNYIFAAIFTQPWAQGQHSGSDCYSSECTPFGRANYYSSCPVALHPHWNSESVSLALQCN